MDVQLPDGTTLKDIPDGTTKSQIAAKLKGSGHAVPDDWLKPAPYHSPTLAEHADIAASTLTGGLASMAGGVVKVGGYANQVIGKVLGHDPGDANAAAAKLEDTLTWTPKTDKGRAVMADVSKGLKAFEDWTDKQGEQAAQAIAVAGSKSAEVAKSLGAPKAVVDFIDRHKDQVAAAYGSATKTSLNAVPLVVGGELSKLKGAREPGLAPGEVPRPAEAAPPAAAPAATPPPDLSLAPSAPRAAPGAPAAVSAPVPTPELALAPSAPRPAPPHPPTPASRSAPPHGI